MRVFPVEFMSLTHEKNWMRHIFILFHFSRLCQTMAMANWDKNILTVSVRSRHSDRGFWADRWYRLHFMRLSKFYRQTCAHSMQKLLVIFSLRCRDNSIKWKIEKEKINRWIDIVYLHRSQNQRRRVSLPMARHTRHRSAHIRHSIPLKDTLRSRL